MVKIIIVDEEDTDGGSSVHHTPGEEVKIFLGICFGAALFYPILVGAVYFVMNPAIAFFRDQWPVEEIYRMISWTESFLMFGLVVAVYALMTLPGRDSLSAHKIWVIPLLAAGIAGYPFVPM